MKKTFYNLLMVITTSITCGNHIILSQTILKKLPLGTSSFKKIIENDYLYVDKTKNIHDLLQSGRHYFLVRPHRFGRTLLLSTLKEMLSGNKTLFKDCWIGQHKEYTWPTYPIIHIDFHMINDNLGDTFAESLLRNIYFLAEQHNLVLPKNLSLEESLSIFLTQLSLRGNIVLLIDEYDKPFRKHQSNQQEASKITQTLKKFYEVVGKFDDRFHIVFITGIVPYASSILFSAIPKLKNISTTTEGHNLCGFADQELESILFPYIKQCASYNHKSPSEIIQELNNWYGGYRFTKTEQTLCSPIPVLYFFDQMQHGLYWLETSTPTFLVQWLKIFSDLFQNQQPWKMCKSNAYHCELGELTASTALWYAGYLTLNEKQYAGYLTLNEKQDDQEEQYCLTFPNRGTQDGFRFLLSQTINRELKTVTQD